MAEALSIATERKLAEFVGQFVHDPYGFVMAAYPWGKPGTKLANKKGPEPWQEKYLIALGKHSRNNAILKSMGLEYVCWRSAVASGHGVGKSAIVAWIIHWLMSTRADCRGVVTANTGDQLENKTWPELGKWTDLLINKHWFTKTATSFYFAAHPAEKQKNYMVTAQTVSPERTEAFAGLHNEGSAVFIIKDEASAIDPAVWEVAEGAFTDGEPFDINFGNPTRADGAFAECFNKNSQRMTYLAHVDSREVSHTNKGVLNQIIALYGAESDEAKIRVYGQFPSQSFDGFISINEVTAAAERELYGDPDAALVLGVDVARYGDDTTVLFARRGRDARSIPRQTFKGLSSVDVAKRVKDFVEKYRPDAIVIESTGPGVGTIDTLRSWNINVIEVHPGEPAERFEAYINRRAELWAKMRTWLTVTGGCIPEDPKLTRQLTGIKYMMVGSSEQKMQMESKKQMKTRGLESPDDADALVLTFHLNPARRRHTAGARGNARAMADYDEFA